MSVALETDVTLHRVEPVQRGGGMAQRGLLGLGKMNDFDVDLNSEPFADIPDDEVAGDLGTQRHTHSQHTHTSHVEVR
jgi:hypothetical protein